MGVLDLFRLTEKTLTPPASRGWMKVFESFPGACQQDVTVNRDSVLAFHADFACRTLIASDIAKLSLRLVCKDQHGIWSPAVDRTYSPVFRRPNHFQTRIQFIESWVLSKLQTGNAYILKQRDNRDHVTALYVLDPGLVEPLVADDGSVFYRLNTDRLAGLPAQVTVPAREVIHDRFNCFHHPLLGLSPIFAGGLAATQGLAIQNDSATFFKNGASPAVVLTAPGVIGEDTAARVKAKWEEGFSGKNSGRTAILGDGLKPEILRMKSVDAQVIENLKWTAEVVCGVYHVPAFMAGVGAEPNYNNVQNLTLRYYSQCLQVLIESIEACLDEGLGLDGVTVGTEFDVDDLLRMDTATQFDVIGKMKGWAKLNEQRRRGNLAPIDDADTVFMQQQDHSLAAIAARDSQLITRAGMSESGDVQAEALNGAQITAMQGLVISAAAGEVPVDSVEAIINAAFPLLSDEQVGSIVNPVRQNSASDDTLPPAPDLEPDMQAQANAALIEIFKGLR